MGVGKSSSRPCVVCGQHKGNIVEPVSMHTKCLDHRKYFTRPEKIAKVINEYCSEAFDDVFVTDHFVNKLTEKIMEVI